jgi:hypothetical protein
VKVLRGVVHSRADTEAELRLAKRSAERAEVPADRGLARPGCGVQAVQQKLSEFGAVGDEQTVDGGEDADPLGLVVLGRSVGDVLADDANHAVREGRPARPVPRGAEGLIVAPQDR